LPDTYSAVGRRRCDDLAIGRERNGLDIIPMAPILGDDSAIADPHQAHDAICRAEGKELTVGGKRNRQPAAGLPFYAVNAVDGSVAWAAKLDGLSGTVAIGNPNIYVGTSAGSLYSLSAVDGSLRWQFATDGAIAGGPALGDVNGDGWAEVLAGSADGDIYAIDSPDDKPLPLWVARLGVRITASPALANGVLYLVAEGGDISRGTFFALDTATGEVLIQTGMRSTVHSSPIVADGKVFIAVDDGDIHMIVPPVPE
jgi:PQQ-like domain/PQQ enzyme repeat